MARAELPENGELRVGAVALPPGRRVVPDGHEPVAWVTSTAVPDPGRVWLTLRDMRAQTGLVPVLLDDDPGADAEDYFFYDPVDPRLIDGTDPARLLAEGWHDPGEDEDFTAMPPFVGRRTNAFLGLRGPGNGPASLADFVAAIAGLAADPGRNAELERLNRLDREEEGWPPPPPPSPRPARAPMPFPGLAPAVQERLSATEITAALAGQPPALICLVPAARPADILAVTGWSTTDAFDDPPMGIVAGSVLRSWEDRFGAWLFQLGPSADIRLLVERPPRTPEAVQQVAAEHWAFAQAFHEQGQIGFQELAGIIPGLPRWQFWWD
jgi:hypothetical protein